MSDVRPPFKLPPQLATSAEAVFVCDAEGRLIALNPSATRITGLSPEALLGMDLSAALLGRRHSVARRMAEETLRQNEQRHRLNEERYRALFEDSPFPLWEEDFSQVKLFLAGLKAAGVTDLRAHLAAHRDLAEECVRRVRVLDVNRAARDFYGVETKDELRGDLSRLFDDAAYEIFCEEMAELDATNSTFKTEFHTRTMRGEERTVSMIVSLAASPQDWSRVIVSFFDVTDRKRLEEQVLQSQKLESLGRLAGGIAHDFNNLLMVISGYAELLLAEVERPESVVRSLREIAGAAARGSDLTRQLLAFSRKSAARHFPLSLNSLIRESEHMLRRVIGEDVRLVIQLAPEEAAIVGDRGQLQQVLMNLVVNAREAMPGGGILSIVTRNLEASGGWGERVLLEVSDSGVGMDEETRRNAFEPFFTTRPAGKGTGLGLATVFGIVTQAGGQISVDSEPGRGSSFSAWFPRVKTLPAAASSAPPAAGAAPQGKTVLLVEDEPDVRRVASAMLRNLGYEVLEAADGAAALELATAFPRPIHILLTDVIMPVINGREVAEQFSVLRPDARIGFMSGYTDRIVNPSDASIPLLEKPFTGVELAAFMRRTLGS